nr:MAG TPA: hypothetical protein [Caudoviricetes sp.]
MPKVNNGIATRLPFASVIIALIAFLFMCCDSSDGLALPIVLSSLLLSKMPNCFASYP